ncbi:MAG: DEAD/DEAH box helicase family protein [Cyanobacteria bacterium MAG CAR3_bin_5]|nr:DEAD/DEAH box helicase family protein [Cyanobacteria bacterium MAG CAR3_bin_5]
MASAETQNLITKAIRVIHEMSPQETDGIWLEDLTVQIGPHIKEWDITCCYPWSQWPERERLYPASNRQDVGIDVVGVRSDHQLVAIQCKSRKLNADGRGGPIHKAEIDKFISATAAPHWTERWIVTNGDNHLSDNVHAAVAQGQIPIKTVNITNDLLQQQTAFADEEGSHCHPGPDSEEGHQTKTDMQAEAIAASVRILREHERSESGGLPVGQARGKIILPCGTGKTRISLRIVEELTPPGELSAVLCPSIALVAQIRREYLQNAKDSIRVLAVCSDETAGYDPKKEGSRNTAKDPTVDNSNVSASEVRGKVTTSPDEIADWIREGRESGRRSVIFGTYQSGHRVAEALTKTGTTAKVLIADEAHRTAGLRRRRRKASEGVLSEEAQRIRDFTLCHDNDAFPVTYRVYQTATPRIYDTRKVNRDQASDWVVRTMDDETVFGVELYRKSYVEAVEKGWLADYRIIALGINDPESYQAAKRLANNTKSKGRHALTTTDYLRGLAFVLAMGGATQGRGNADVPLKSCIAFMNTVDKSKNMAQDLATDTVREWLQKWLHDNRGHQAAANYTLEHLDATSNVAARDSAKRRLAKSSKTSPYGIINVGIFGEGTDSPSLSAVAFLEPRKSPIDVIQAVGRAMRTAPDKDTGYIICPILIPASADPEQWLSVSSMEEGWQELGQILLALRAHDSRIEDNLEDLLQLYVPKPPETLGTIVAVARGEDRRISYWKHQGPPGEAQKAMERVLGGKSTPADEFNPIVEEQFNDSHTSSVPGNVAEPTQIIAGKKNDDGSLELRMDSVARTDPAPDGTPGRLDIRKSKGKGKDMINKGTGVRLPHSSKQRKRRTRREMGEHYALQMLLLSGMDEYGNAIKMNLLSRSGLVNNKVVRDLNILESSVKEAAHHLNADGLQSELCRHFGLGNLKKKDLNKQADGCTIAALLMMNAAMLHQRIANGRWLSGVSHLDSVKNDVNVVHRISQEWNQIMRHDFRPVLKPAVSVIETIEDTGKLAGLERALRHIAAEAERIAETYADMGADHAGPLFNRVMGNQESDSAFFTRPVAASIAARLTLDVCGDVNWADRNVWEAHKTVDLACGSGTLLAAMLTDMKRRARNHGANEDEIAELQKLAVEETIKGLDINPVSLQLAASQLTAGNHEIRYRNMGLYKMSYGPSQDNKFTYLSAGTISAGSLELLMQKAIVSRDNELDLSEYNALKSKNVWGKSDNSELGNEVSASKDAQIIIMNPPFSSRSNVGKKFQSYVQKALRKRIDLIETNLIHNDENMNDFVDKNSIGPLFIALADRCVNQDNGIITMIHPTISLCNVLAEQERKLLTQRYHIHTILTCHEPSNYNLVQQSNINESIMVLKRNNSHDFPTRFIQLDRLPVNEVEVNKLHQCIIHCQKGQMQEGWGEIFYWPAEYIKAGDWTQAIWRSNKLAKAATKFSNDKELIAIKEISGVHIHSTYQTLYKNFEESELEIPESFPILASTGADGQLTIKSNPDQHRRKNKNSSHLTTEKMLNKAAYLLIVMAQRNTTGRLAACADLRKYVGIGYIPITGFTINESKAVAVFINSTPGRLQLMRNPTRTLEFPRYNPAASEKIRIPNIKDNNIICQTLANCWEHTKNMEVPQYRDGECEVRRLWDEAVAKAMDWDPAELERLRLLLHREPHVCGMGYNQYADEVEVQPADRQSFQELADRWEAETALLSNLERSAQHPAHQEIVTMGKAAVPLILERIRSQGGLWFHALSAITGANPVAPDDHGNVAAMQESWLKWGERNGYG